MDNTFNKSSIRKEILEKLKDQSPADRERKSLEIMAKLFSSAAFNKAKVVMFYVSTDVEVDTGKMIKKALEKGKIVAVPYSASETKKIIASELKNPGRELEKGAYGIYQPKKEFLREVPLEKIDAVVVPALAYDENNNRLGRGKGYYDRFLEGLSPETGTIGVCFDFQRVKSLPKDSHDQPVSQVITN